MTSKHFQLTTLALLLSTSTFADTTLSTQENNEAVELNTINVQAKNRSRITEKDYSLTTSAMQTTTGLSLSPKETPQSVSVVTKTMLDKQAISNMEDALKTTTGINVITDAGYWRYQSRGFYIDKIQDDGLSTTVRGSVDNTFRDPQSMTDLIIYDHIEVVRGPTGLTQAGGEPGGTINAVRKRPTSRFQNHANILLDSNGKRRASIDISGPIKQWDDLRGRLIVLTESDPTSVNLPRDNKKQLIYGVLDKNLGDNNQLTLGMLYQKTDITPNIYGVPMGPNSTESGLNRDTYLGYDWNREQAYKFNVFAELNTYFNDDWKLNNKISYTRNRNTNQSGFIANTSTNYTGLVKGNTLATNNMQQYQNSGSQLVWQSNLTGKYRLFNRDHELFITYSFEKETTDTHWRRIRNTTAYDPFTFTGKEITQPNWNTDYDDQVFYHSTIYSHGLAIGTHLHLSDKLHVLAGTRYSRWKRIGLTDYDWWNGKADSDPDVHTYYTRNRFVPYLGITYDITPNQSLYASYTSIFKPQSGKDKSNNPIKPVIGDNYEIGWKTEWFNGKLNTALALFQITQSNRRIWVEDKSYKDDGYYNTSGKVRSRGLDLEISGSLNENWQLFAGYTYNRSKYLETEGARYTTGTNFSKHTPVHMFRLYTTYTLPINNQKWSIGAGISSQSKTESLYGVKQSGYTLWNADIQYRINKNATISLIGKNLTDKHYFENNRVRTMGANNFYGQRRTFTLNFDWKFQ